MLPRSLFGALFAGAFVLAFASSVTAAEVTIEGYTSGCFGAACIPVDSLGNLQTVTAAPPDRLSFTNADFGPTPTVAGVLNPVLGTFSLNPQGNNDFTGQEFNLTVTFTLPTVIVGDSSTTFSAILTGFAASNDAQCPGGEAGSHAECADLSINFSNLPIAFNYANPDAEGSFSFFVDDVSFLYQDSANVAVVRNVQGHITNAVERPLTRSGGEDDPLLVAAPEPGSMILLGTGIAALAAVRLRRRKA